jgi:hypothetical protein
MKNFNRVFIPATAIIFSMTMFFACGSDGTSTSDAKTDTAQTDTTILDNYNNEYPKDRIHITDSNKGKDSMNREPAKKDSLKK